MKKKRNHLKKIVKNIVNAYEGIYETEATEHSLKTRILLMDE